MEQGILNRADGSARFVQGNTSVLAAVYGPAPAKSARMEKPDGATVDVNFKPESGMASAVDAEREVLLRRSLEEVILRSRYPRSVVSVVIQVYITISYENLVWLLLWYHVFACCSVCAVLYERARTTAAAYISCTVVV